ncbi:hypothetical protein AM493_00750 [Flavobacterium akiainvivens]|uniref:Lipoprotein n=1 Tax=Flavobacterium akiainvivens TaxID=1202724 RepID=A0A0M8MFJ9_9FLAO|nr:hypothetical protein [Flavobacterium akiainvivens]KOS04737.1 hypothetical protein AM493_00750 [Flavobacterium akiainvivens]SFQ66863.1 hypothetical protein SAMN05444144_11372 [Flavobacterium akiainvivens]
MKNLLAILCLCLLLASCKKENPVAAPLPQKDIPAPQPAAKPTPPPVTAEPVADLPPPKPAPVNPDKELYAVVNLCLTERRIAGDTKEMKLYLVAYDERDVKDVGAIHGMPKEDRAFMSRQAADTTRIQIDTTRLVRPVKIVSYQDHKGEFSYSYISLSKPVFNREYTYAVIECNHYCGQLCGSGRRIYLKKNSAGKWEFDKRGIVPTWIS